MRPQKGKWFLVLPFVLCSVLTAATEAPPAPEPSSPGFLKPGPCAVGFRMAAMPDGSRTFHSNLAVRGLPADTEEARVVRIYLWYPARAERRETMRLEEYVRLAAEDSGAPAGKGRPAEAPALPVPIAEGLSPEERRELLRRPMIAVRDAGTAGGRFPLVLLGQGLYYESPLSQVVLAESLASRGYAVATCPLVGTRSRLVNMNVVDLETAVRDLEFVLAQVSALPYVDGERLGVVGYDLGGMAGLLLCMRNTRVGAFASLDSGILEPHFSGLPRSSPHYDEGRFVVPWLHATQSRFAGAGRGQKRKLPFWDAKSFGDSYLILLDTASHGDFSSYANFGIGREVPGYWGPVQGDPRRRHEALCEYVARFFDAYLKGEAAACGFLRRDIKEAGLEDALASVVFKEGAAPPAFADDCIEDIILHGTAAALPKIRGELASGRSAVRWDEGSLNWLGYHLLYWWGREGEAVDVFLLATEIFPRSANAFDSLGEAYLALGDKGRAAESYRRSLALDPRNENARKALGRLAKR